MTLRTLTESAYSLFSISPFAFWSVVGTLLSVLALAIVSVAVYFERRCARIAAQMLVELRWIRRDQLSIDEVAEMEHLKQVLRLRASPSMPDFERWVAIAAETGKDARGDDFVRQCVAQALGEAVTARCCDERLGPDALRSATQRVVGVLASIRSKPFMNELVGGNEPRRIEVGENRDKG